MDRRYILVLVICLVLLIALESRRASRRERKRTVTNSSSSSSSSSTSSAIAKVRSRKNMYQNAFSTCIDIKGSYGLKQHCCFTRRKRKATTITDSSLAANANGSTQRSSNQSHRNQQQMLSLVDAGMSSQSSRNRNITCLPSFIIAGTQKSATTLLSALLSEHPHISFAPKKEVHFFDRSSYYKKGKRGYLSYFSPWQIPNVSSISEVKILKSITMPVYGEATPFYIASRYGCKRMSEMIPQVKIIVLMREPISRAYSEYQMKKRRVESQNNFIDLVKHYEEQLYWCLIKHKLEFEKLKECLPIEITSHSHYPKLKASLKQHEKSSNGGFSGVMGTCFNRVPEGSFSYSLSSSISLYNNASIDNTSANIKDDKHDEYAWDDPWPADVNEMINENHHEIFNSYLDVTTGTVDFSPLQNLRTKSDYIFNDGSSTNLVSLYESEDSLNTSTYMTRLKQDYSSSTVRKSTGYFQPDACLMKYARESIPTVTLTMQEEVEQLEKCGAYVLHKLRCSSPKDVHISRKYQEFKLEQPICRSYLSPSDNKIISEVMNMSSSTIASGQKLFFEYIKEQQTDMKVIWPGVISPVETEVIVRKCVNITSGISKQFLYRSMYAPQISQCMRHFPREQFLFLPSEQLKREPKRFLHTVLRFIGFNTDTELEIPDHMYDINNSDINSLIARRFPQFEEATGWKLQGKYPNIPNAIVKRLMLFFKPLNEALFSLIDKDFVDEWYR